MFKKLRTAITLSLTNLFITTNALANDYGGVDSQDPTTLGNKIVELVKTIGMPIGGGLLFFSVLIIAIKLILSSGNAKKRAEAMEGLLYVGIGGAIIGAALFIAGALLGIGESIAA